jgi:muramoyltetrapeptide carboxypeptidase
VRIGIVAPSCRVDDALPEKLLAFTAKRGDAAPEIIFHPQCFLSEGHFAGPDAARIAAFVDCANDPTLDAIWFGRGGYGAGRVAEDAIRQLGPAAQNKLYMGYSDAGYLLAGLKRSGIGRLAHGPLPADLNRVGGEAAIARALDWFANPVVFGDAGDPYVAFNLTVLCHIIGTPLQPDLTGHILMVEEVAEYMYRIDRLFHQLSASRIFKQIKGLMLGRCSAVPANDPDFVLGEEDVAKHWCARAGVPYLGRADIGHDADNQVIGFG